MSLLTISNIAISPETLEQLGTKEKFWFRSANSGGMCLFKFSRENTGEHWSEKIAEMLCSKLGIPHAEYQLAVCVGEKKRYGVISKRINLDGWQLRMGNEVLFEYSPTQYPQPEANKAIRYKEHTVSRVLKYLDEGNILSLSTALANVVPTYFHYSIKFEDLNAGDIFCAYLMLDALISNQDRHHENWAILLNPSGEKYLCHSYDHAASLGRELQDSERVERLQTKDFRRSVDYFVTKARSEIFLDENDSHPMYTVDAFHHAVSGRNNARLYWLSMLEQLTEEDIESIVLSIPSEVMSDVSKSFAIKMILTNRKRILRKMENTVYVAWQDTTSRAWHVVGKLHQYGAEYVFQYTNGVKKVQNFVPFMGNGALTEVYRSEVLFPFFRNRLLSEKRPEYPLLVEWLGFNTENGNPTALETLGRSGGTRATDTMQIFNDFVSDDKGKFDYYFFAHGLSHLSEAENNRLLSLKVGEKLTLLPELDNQYDENAVLIKADNPSEKVGYCPRFLSKAIKEMLSAKSSKITITVAKISSDAPFNYRLMCKISGKITKNFSLEQREDYQAYTE